MPKIIRDAKEIFKHFRSLEVIASNAVTYRELIEHDFSSVVIEDLYFTDQYQLVRVDNRIDSDHFELALLDVLNESVVYYNQITIRDDVILNARPATQVLIWRSPRPEYYEVLRDLPATVFNKYLILHYSIIITDSQQTMDGYSFWQRRLYDAIQSGHYIYAYRVLVGRLDRIKNPEELEKMTQEIWSEKYSSEFRLMILSSEPLPLT